MNLSIMFRCCFDAVSIIYKFQFDDISTITPDSPTPLSKTQLHRSKQRFTIQPIKEGIHPRSLTAPPPVLPPWTSSAARIHGSQARRWPRRGSTGMPDWWICLRAYSRGVGLSPRRKDCSGGRECSWDAHPPHGTMCLCHKHLIKNLRNIIEISSKYHRNKCISKNSDITYDKCNEEEIHW